MDKALIYLLTKNLSSGMKKDNIFIYIKEGNVNFFATPVGVVSSVLSTPLIWLVVEKSRVLCRSPGQRLGTASVHPKNNIHGKPSDKGICAYNKQTFHTSTSIRDL